LRPAPLAELTELVAIDVWTYRESGMRADEYRSTGRGMLTVAGARRLIHLV
jgi:hypothetical protein